MNREEEILNKAIDYSEIEENFLEYDDCGYVCNDKEFIEQAFIEGAKWADKTMIEKACNWLKDRISIPYKGNYYEDSEQPIASDYINFAIERLKKAEEFCKGFKKAMEEE